MTDETNDYRYEPGLSEEEEDDKPYYSGTKNDNDEYEEVPIDDNHPRKYVTKEQIFNRTRQSPVEGVSYPPATTQAAQPAEPKQIVKDEDKPLRIADIGTAIKTLIGISHPEAVPALYSDRDLSKVVQKRGIEGYLHDLSQTTQQGMMLRQLPTVSKLMQKWQEKSIIPLGKDDKDSYDIKRDLAAKELPFPFNVAPKGFTSTEYEERPPYEVDRQLATPGKITYSKKGKRIIEPGARGDLYVTPEDFYNQSAFEKEQELEAIRKQQPISSFLSEELGAVAPMELVGGLTHKALASAAETKLGSKIGIPSILEKLNANAESIYDISKNTAKKQQIENLAKKGFIHPSDQAKFLDLTHNYLDPRAQAEMQQLSEKIYDPIVREQLLSLSKTGIPAQKGKATAELFKRMGAHGLVNAPLGAVLGGVESKGSLFRPDGEGGTTFDPASDLAMQVYKDMLSGAAATSAIGAGIIGGKEIGTGGYRQVRDWLSSGTQSLASNPDKKGYLRNLAAGYQYGYENELPSSRASETGALFNPTKEGSARRASNTAESIVKGYEDIKTDIGKDLNNVIDKLVAEDNPTQQIISKKGTGVTSPHQYTLAPNRVEINGTIVNVDPSKTRISTNRIKENDILKQFYSTSSKKAYYPQEVQDYNTVAKTMRSSGIGDEFVPAPSENTRFSLGKAITNPKTGEVTYEMAPGKSQQKIIDYFTPKLDINGNPEFPMTQSIMEDAKNTVQQLLENSDSAGSYLHVLEREYKPRMQKMYDLASKGSASWDDYNKLKSVYKSLKSAAVESVPEYAKHLKAYEDVHTDLFEKMFPGMRYTQNAPQNRIDLGDKIKDLLEGVASRKTGAAESTNKMFEGMNDFITKQVNRSIDTKVPVRIPIFRVGEGRTLESSFMQLSPEEIQRRFGNLKGRALQGAIKEMANDITVGSSNAFLTASDELGRIQSLTKGGSMSGHVGLRGKALAELVEADKNKDSTLYGASEWLGRTAGKMGKGMDWMANLPEDIIAGASNPENLANRLRKLGSSQMFSKEVSQQLLDLSESMHPTSEGQYQRLINAVQQPTTEIPRISQFSQKEVGALLGSEAEKDALKYGPLSKDAVQSLLGQTEGLKEKEANEVLTGLANRLVKMNTKESSALAKTLIDSIKYGNTPSKNAAIYSIVNSKKYGHIFGEMDDK